MVSVDFFTVPTGTFRVLFIFIVFAHQRRRVLHFNVTEHPTAEWTAQQIIEAFPWDTYHTARTHLSLDKDAPDHRLVQPAYMGKVVALPHVGGLHHQYVRLAA